MLVTGTRLFVYAAKYVFQLRSPKPSVPLEEKLAGLTCRATLGTLGPSIPADLQSADCPGLGRGRAEGGGKNLGWELGKSGRRCLAAAMVGIRLRWELEPRHIVPHCSRPLVRAVNVSSLGPTVLLLKHSCATRVQPGQSVTVFDSIAYPGLHGIAPPSLDTRNRPAS